MAKALLVIDVQTLLFEGDKPPFDADGIIQRINALSHSARENACPVIFIQHEQPGTPIARDTKGWELVSRLVQDENDYVVAKTTPDSFLGTGLKALLDELDVESLAICGYASEFCVDTTVRRALALGYPVELIDDAHTTADKSHLAAKDIIAHENATLCAIKSFGVTAQPVKALEWLPKS
ncbi:cysteine hydrolase [Shewanella sp. JM162201]|uniref:Cysteine hydrolase n=1 Tax=Shewanella jiangmenensis TaxID=2837387 RepID=A0ABS5V9W4_9GAMM|nr:cysteine hydrolase family protein [Shewanella jiangmenensis]MBT1446461.1 cysteine hydrolase [Shewanella jiangmenensis]